MTDMFKINLEYDRDEIIQMAQKAIDNGCTIYHTKTVLDQFYPAWSHDQRTSIMVELMFRGEDDIFHEIFTRELAELNEGVTA